MTEPLGITELIEDLKEVAADSDKCGDGWTARLCRKAAAEIERLRTENNTLRKVS